MSGPRLERMRYGQLLEWLAGEGITEHMVRKWIGLGTIKKHYFPGDARAYYSRAEIDREILNAPETQKAA